MKKSILLACLAFTFGASTLYAQEVVPEKSKKNKTTKVLDEEQSSSSGDSNAFSSAWGNIIVQATPEGKYSIVAGSSYDSENGIKWFYPEGGVIEFKWDDVAINLTGNSGTVIQTYPGKGAQNMTFEVVKDCSSIDLYESFDKICLSLTANNNTFIGAMFMTSSQIQMQEGDVSIDCTGQWRFIANGVTYTYYFKPLE